MTNHYDKLFEFYKHLCTVVTGVTLVMVAIAGQMPADKTVGAWILAIALSTEVFSLIATVIMLHSVALADFAESQEAAHPARMIETPDGIGSTRSAITLAKEELFGTLGTLLHLLSLLLFLLGVVSFVVFACLNLIR